LRLSGKRTAPIQSAVLSLSPAEVFPRLGIRQDQPLYRRFVHGQRGGNQHITTSRTGLSIFWFLSLHFTLVGQKRFRDVTPKKKKLLFLHQATNKGPIEEPREKKGLLIMFSGVGRSPSGLAPGPKKTLRAVKTVVLFCFVC